MTKTTILVAAALLWMPCASVPADNDRESYNRRAAQTDMSLFGELDRKGNGFLTRDDIAGDMRLGTRFDDIDTNRDGIVTAQEMRTYVERTYGALPAPVPGAPR